MRRSRRIMDEGQCRDIASPLNIRHGLRESILQHPGLSAVTISLADFSIKRSEVFICLKFSRFILCVCECACTHAHTRVHTSAHMIQVTVVITDIKCSWSWGYRGLPVTPHGHWELILGPLQEKHVLSTAEPSL